MQHEKHKKETWQRYWYQRQCWAYYEACGGQTRCGRSYRRPFADAACGNNWTRKRGSYACNRGNIQRDEQVHRVACLFLVRPEFRSWICSGCFHDCGLQLPWTRWICCGAQSVQAVPDKRSGQLHWWGLDCCLRGSWYMWSELCFERVKGIRSSRSRQQWGWAWRNTETHWSRGGSRERRYGIRTSQRCNWKIPGFLWTVRKVSFELLCCDAF